MDPTAHTEKWVVTNVTDSFYTVAYPKGTTVGIHVAELRSATSDCWDAVAVACSQGAFLPHCSPPKAQISSIFCPLQRLLKYFKGQNDKGTYLNITTPTMSYLELDDDRKGTKKAYTFGWFISSHIKVPVS